MSWSNRVYRSIEDDVLRSSITTGHEPYTQTKSILSILLHLTSRLMALSRANVYNKCFLVISSAKEKNENRRIIKTINEQNKKKFKTSIRFVVWIVVNEMTEKRDWIKSLIDLLLKLVRFKNFRNLSNKLDRKLIMYKIVQSVWNLRHNLQLANNNAIIIFDLTFSRRSRNKFITTNFR